MTGSLKLKDHPGDTVRIVCEKCRQRGQYRKGKLIAIYGPDIPLPDLRVEIAQCERAGYLQTWTVSRQVNSSRAPSDDPTLIERVAA